MIVAVFPMRVMQSAVDQIVDVVPMRNCLVTTAGTVLMFFATMFRSAADRVLLTHIDHVLVDVPFVRME